MLLESTSKISGGTSTSSTNCSLSIRWTENRWPRFGMPYLVTLNLVEARPRVLAAVEDMDRFRGRRDSMESWPSIGGGTRELSPSTWIISLEDMPPALWPS